ncbi:glycosyltransferase family 39 protein [Adhaeribacter terreus]|uniref:Glycosyltransferase family 39 protein n=1 Tax=Adhaeribacter terreus TaxID=529703 RepID=A0ABW0EFZ7_9BACT
MANLKPTYLFQLKKHGLPAVFFVLYLILGLSIYTHYGISFDEHWGRENGIINAKYIVQKLAPGNLAIQEFCVGCPTLADYPDADHGPVFEIGTTFLEFVFGIKDPEAIYKLRHLCSFLVFYLGSIFFYLLLHDRFRNSLISLTGVLLLVLSPRIFAESFYNAKDLPFLALMIIGTYTLIRFVNKPALSTAFWHGLACGLALDIRILGLLLPAATLAASLLNLKGIRPDGISAKVTFVNLSFFLLFFAVFTIAFWPVLWENPIGNFLNILSRSSKYPWPGNVLYQGYVIAATALPWHYLPVWFFITTPLGYTLLFLAGFSTVLMQVFRSGLALYKNAQERQDLILAGLFVVPILAAIFLKLVLYDGWRHMYFIYPPFIYVATLGIYTLYRKSISVTNKQTGKILQTSLVAALLFLMGSVAFWMVKNHPYQNVYFSIYKDDSVRQKFELDYWGLAYKQGLEFIIKDSDKPAINVYVANLPGRINQYSLPPEQRQRLVYVDHISKADYFLTEYRWHPTDYPLQQEVYQIKVDNIKIFSVFKPDKVYKELKTHLY